MLKGIIAITGKPGLYKLLSRGRNSLIVEALATGKRMPSHAHEKVVSLPDVTMYAERGDVPLPEVLESLKTVAEGQPVDLKGFADDSAVRDFFGKVLPDYDRDRVYNTDMRKLFNWYNKLIAAGSEEFVEKEKAEDENKDDVKE